jgi:hypothetical protein
MRLRCLRPGRVLNCGTRVGIGVTYLDDELFVFGESCSHGDVWLFGCVLVIVLLCLLQVFCS